MAKVRHKGQLANSLYLNMNSGSKPLSRILTITTVDEIWHMPWLGEELGAPNLDLNPVYRSQSVYMFLANIAHDVLPGFGLTSESGFWIQNRLYNSYHQNSKTVHGFRWQLTHGSIRECLFIHLWLYCCVHLTILCQQISVSPTKLSTPPNVWLALYKE